MVLSIFGSFSVPKGLNSQNYFYIQANIKLALKSQISAEGESPSDSLLPYSQWALLLINLTRWKSATVKTRLKARLILGLESSDLK